MTDATGHLPFWTLEQLAEGDLSHAERMLAEQHLRTCAHCASELRSARALISALQSLPAVSPSAGFADAVMARVVIAPRTATAAAAEPARQARKGWLPASFRGWVWLTAMLTVIMAPLTGLGVWLSTHPLVSVSALWGIARGWVSEVAWGAVVQVAGAFGRSGLFGWAADTLARMPGPDAAGVPLSLLLFFAAIPVSAFVIVRLLKTPATGMTHAY
ncbi:anti-sigma factor family protein [Longimicrobium sp.]|uniref:anti-sigma factor n=1 Tax=Longimicrobium sp. TaxID=2029185 RepID=UPI003B3BCB77